MLAEELIDYTKEGPGGTMSLNIELIRESFEKAKPIADKVVNKFYEFLWADYPPSKALFNNIDMERQKKQLLNSLVFVVDNVDNTDKLVPYLKKMGARHVDYGTQEEHYPMVASTLIKTFAYFFDDEWTQELEDQWNMALGVVAEQMIAGARESSQQETETTIDFQSKLKERCHQEINGSIDHQISDLLDTDDFRDKIREKVRSVIEEVYEEEVNAFFKKAA